VLRKKTLTLHGGRPWSPPTWPLHACTASSLGPTKNRPLPWSAEEDARGRRAGIAPLGHRETSLSWQGRRTAPRKTDGDVAAGPPPCRTSPESRGTYLRRRRGRRKPEKGIEGRRQGGAFIKKVRMREWYDDYQTLVANEGAGPGLFDWRTVCFSPFNLQSNFVSHFLRQP
jgi:hypothetical protein